MATEQWTRKLKAVENHSTFSKNLKKSEKHGKGHNDIKVGTLRDHNPHYLKSYKMGYLYDRKNWRSLIDKEEKKKVNLDFWNSYFNRRWSFPYFFDGC